MAAKFTAAPILDRVNPEDAVAFLIMEMEPAEGGPPKLHGVITNDKKIHWLTDEEEDASPEFSTVERVLKKFNVPFGKEYMIGVPQDIDLSNFSKD
ncbi:MAG: hypothetical protein WCA07_16700 [Gloeobacterales cyanobacterium]